MQSTTTIAPARLEWSISRQTDALEIHYTVHNLTGGRIHVAESLLVSTPSGLRPTDRLRVLPGTGERTVRLVRGLGESTSPIALETPPSFTGLDPGRPLHGRGSVPPPVELWHDLADPKPLARPPIRATLELAVILDEAGEWEILELAGGGEATLPNLGFYKRASLVVAAPALPVPGQRRKRK